MWCNYSSRVSRHFLMNQNGKFWWIIFGRKKDQTQSTSPSKICSNHKPVICVHLSSGEKKIFQNSRKKREGEKENKKCLLSDRSPSLEQINDFTRITFFFIFFFGPQTFFLKFCFSDVWILAFCFPIFDCYWSTMDTRSRKKRVESFILWALQWNLAVLSVI